MSKRKWLIGIGSWIGLVLFAGMILWMLGDILQRDGVIGSKTDVLVMGTNAGFKPFEYIDNKEIVGFDVDLMREIANKSETTKITMLITCACLRIPIIRLSVLSPSTKKRSGA